MENNTQNIFLFIIAEEQILNEWMVSNKQNISPFFPLSSQFFTVTRVIATLCSISSESGGEADTKQVFREDSGCV